jgi:hypothetical protein
MLWHNPLWLRSIGQPGLVLLDGTRTEHFPHNLSLFCVELLAPCQAQDDPSRVLETVVLTQSNARAVPARVTRWCYNCTPQTCCTHCILWCTMYSALLALCDVTCFPCLLDVASCACLPSAVVSSCALVLSSKSLRPCITSRILLLKSCAVHVLHMPDQLSTNTPCLHTKCGQNSLDCCLEGLATLAAQALNIQQSRHSSSFAQLCRVHYPQKHSSPRHAWPRARHGPCMYGCIDAREMSCTWLGSGHVCAWPLEPDRYYMAVYYSPKITCCSATAGRRSAGVDVSWLVHKADLSAAARCLPRPSAQGAVLSRLQIEAIHGTKEWGVAVAFSLRPHLYVEQREVAVVCRWQCQPCWAPSRRPTLHLGSRHESLRLVRIRSAVVFLIEYWSWTRCTKLA